MKGFYRALFYRKKIKVGQIYLLANGDPFGAHKTEILDIKDGWLKYKFTEYSSHYTISITDFLLAYKLTKEGI